MTAPAAACLLLILSVLFVMLGIGTDQIYASPSLWLLAAVPGPGALIVDPIRNYSGRIIKANQERHNAYLGSMVSVSEKQPETRKQPETVPSGMEDQESESEIDQCPPAIPAEKYHVTGIDAA